MGDIPAQGKDNQQFSELEIDSLQELMNIAFGNAAAELAESIDIFVELSAPKMRPIRVEELTEYISAQIIDFNECSIIEQYYRGDISGAAFLIFPYGVERDFVSLFQDQDFNALQSDLLIELEKEILLEVGNILIGACLGKFFDLLQGAATFLPPRAIIGDKFHQTFIQGAFDKEDDYALILHLKFTFEDRDVAGYLFLINHRSSFSKVKSALQNYWEQYQ